MEPTVHEDNRGHLLETYSRQEFKEAGIDHDVAHSYCSRSKKDVIRGLHMQTEPAQQAKLVHCIQGAIFDVAVDARDDSDSFGEYVSAKLSSDNMNSLYVPEGFLHGFLSLTDQTVVHCMTSNEYSPENEQGVIWNDPEIDIEWPIDRRPTVSAKDKTLPQLTEIKRV